MKVCVGAHAFVEISVRKAVLDVFEQLPVPAKGGSKHADRTISYTRGDEVKFFRLTFLAIE
jgi:hypothetical protein